MRKFLSLLVVLLTTVINAEAVSRTITVQVSGGIGGTIGTSTSNSSTSVTNWGTNVTYNSSVATQHVYLFAKPDDGYKFTGWTFPSENPSTNNPYDYTLMSTTTGTITATFSKIACTNTSTSATYTDIQTAVNEASSENTIQLATDVEISSTIKVESAKNFTLDLNGHVLKGTMDAPTENNAYSSILYINHANAAITIIDTDPTATHTQEGLTDIKGGVITGGKGILTNKEGTLTDAKVFGGAIYLGTGTLNIGTDTYSGGTITGNGYDKVKRGGGVENSSGTLKIKNCTISNNSVSASDGEGGGVHAGGYTEMTKCTIKGNNAAQGGGLYNRYSSGTNTITECTISNNTAVAGAGIENDKNLDVKKCTISGNTADVYAGGILNYENLTLEDNTSITGNKIGSEGMTLAGVVNMFSESGPTTITLKGKVTIDNNTAKDSKSNLCLLYIENGGTKSGPITLSDDFDNSSKIGVTTFSIDNDENIFYGPYQFTTNYTTNAENAFSSDDSKYAVYHNAEGYLELLPTVTLNSKGYGTFSSAKDVDVATDGIEVYSAAVSDETITLTKQENKYIPAGIGVLLYGGDAKAGTKVTFKAKTNTDAIVANDLKPTTTAADPIVTIPGKGTIWALGDGNEFLKLANSVTSFTANRAYLRTDVPAAKSMTLVFGDETTGVANVDASTSSAQAREGKYIENGRIVIVKNGRKFNLNGQEVK